ncbi:MAG: hypothetical protein P9L96_06535 [Candidatus Gygaella obscura]|nr:hypothetical protein [Candidatus Gygaella obscura]
MILKRYATCLFFFTVVCLLYVGLQTHIIKTGYAIQSKSNIYKQLSDENDSLSYKISCLSSFGSVNNKVVLNDSEFELPKSHQYSKLVINEKIKIAKADLTKRNIFSLFGFQKEAEARPVK